jgi:hypothetical protein
MWVGMLDRLGFRLRPKRRRGIDRLGGDGVVVSVVVHQVRVRMEVQKEVVVLGDVEALGGPVDVVVVVVVVAAVVLLGQSKKTKLMMK